MSAENKAVFLSYASQDSEAAQRICEALRAAGVEVWFDQSELRGGDSWDQKIRRQIKECALFLPIISANTQARREGYFRLEWKLADDRTHLMAKGTPFLVPVCIDDTKDGNALVPDAFLNVQWTRLKAGETDAKFVARVSHLLRAETEASATTPDRRPSTREPAAAGRRGLRWRHALVVAVPIVAGLVLAWRFRPQSATTIATPKAGAVAATPTVADWPRDPQLRRARELIYSLDAIAEDFALAEDIVRPLAAQHPNDPDTAVVVAEVAKEFLLRGFDPSAMRRSQAQKLTERAVQLAPDNPYALIALAANLRFIGSQLPRAEELLRRAIELKPDEARAWRVLHDVLVRTKGEAEADAFAERMLARFPRDPLVRYDIARRHKDANRLAAMEQGFDEVLKLAPIAFAMVWKAWAALELHGDVAGMKSWLDRVPERQRTNTRFANALAIHAIVSGQPAAAIKLVGDLPDAWLTDFDFTGPKALLLGDLLMLDGRPDLARVQYEAALAEVEREKARNPTDARPRRAELWTLLGLGRREEARAVFQVLVQTLARPYRWTINNSWWSGSIRAGLMLGERATAVALLKEAAEEPTARLLIRQSFQLDPRMESLRNDPEIAALLAEPKKEAGLAPADKSVAVLAFENRSSEKDDEFFADGISEELLNVLAKVPGLRVVGRTSAFQFKGKNEAAPVIGKKLNVAHLVEGSVQRGTTHARIIARLVRAETGEQIWSEGFDTELRDMLAAQQQIAAVIARNLSLTLGAPAGAAQQVDPVAHRLVLEGRHFLTLRDTGFADAEAAFTRALAIDPKFAPAHSGLGAVRLLRGVYRQVEGAPDAAADLHEGRLSAERAARLDASLVEAHAVLGYEALLNGRLAESEQHFQRGLVLNPNDAFCHHWHGHLLGRLGRIDLALQENERATQLDPLSFIMLYVYAQQLTHARQHARAFEIIQRSLALRRDFLPSRGLEAVNLLALGRKDEAVAVARAIRDDRHATHRWWADSNAVQVLRDAGQHEEAIAYAEAMLALWPPSNLKRPALLALLGRFDEALSSRENMPSDPFNVLFYCLGPVWDPVRETALFQKRVAELGFADAYKVARETLARMQSEQAGKK